MSDEGSRRAGYTRSWKSSGSASADMAQASHTVRYQPPQTLRFATSLPLELEPQHAAAGTMSLARRTNTADNDRYLSRSGVQIPSQKSVLFKDAPRHVRTRIAVIHLVSGGLDQWQPAGWNVFDARCQVGILRPDILDTLKPFLLGAWSRGSKAGWCWPIGQGRASIIHSQNITGHLIGRKRSL